MDADGFQPIREHVRFAVTLHHLRHPRNLRFLSRLLRRMRHTYGRRRRHAYRRKARTICPHHKKSLGDYRIARLPANLAFGEFSLQLEVTLREAGAFGGIVGSAAAGHQRDDDEQDNGDGSEIFHASRWKPDGRKWRQGKISPRSSGHKRNLHNPVPGETKSAGELSSPGGRGGNDCPHTFIAWRARHGCAP